MAEQKAPTSIDDRIAKADEKRLKAEQRVRQLKAQKERIEARQLAALVKGDRSGDTRRKILVGAFVLSKLDDPTIGPRFADFLGRELGTYLTREDDRALFPDLLGQHADGHQTTEAQS